MKKTTGLMFWGQVARVQTMVDGGIRLTLDLPEVGRAVLEPMARFQQDGEALRFTVEPESAIDQAELPPL